MLAHEKINYQIVDLTGTPSTNDNAPAVKDPFARLRPALVTENMAMARRIASKMARRLPTSLADDVQSAALLGLVEAANRFHPGRGESFPAFAAKRVRGAVLDELRRGDVLPRRARQTARRVREIVRQLEHQLGRVPRDEEIAEKLGVSVDEYQDRIAALGAVEVVSLDELSGGGARSTSEDPAEQVERRRANALVERAREHLSEREAKVLALHYEQQMTLAEIGKLLGVTESRVCQLHTRAIKRLRAELEGSAAPTAKRTRRA
jgi:RNA polymerase sigma factor for flagellar operon FliA